MLFRSEAEGRVVHPRGELEILRERLDEEPGLGLHEQCHADVRGHVEHRHDLVVEDGGGLLTGLAGLQLTAGLRRDRGRTQLGGQP